MTYSILLGVQFLLIPVASAELILSAPPRESTETGSSYYEPIASQLSKILGEPVIYKHPKTWHNYTKQMQAGKYDIVFDGPHFAAWRMHKVNHTPVARLPGNLKFIIMAKKNNEQAKNIQDIIGKRTCGLASPNLGTMVVFQIFNNPVMQPEIQIVKGGFKKVVKEFLAGNCDFAVVRDTIYNNLTDKDKENIKIIAQSTPMPNQTITVSNKIDPAVRTKISNFLVSSQGAKTAANLLNRFSKKKRFFVPANETEYDELENLLEGVVYGW